MIHRGGHQPNAAALAQLREWQAQVDALGSHADRVERGKSLFASHNREDDPAFSEVRHALNALCSGPRRCMYCEDSAATQVEHFRPQAHFPALALTWGNYLYICGGCNVSKGDRFALLTARPVRQLVESRSRSTPPVAPPSGQDVALHPRRDDPLACLTLDLVQTFAFVPRPGSSPWQRLRAEYTIRLCGLNRDPLLDERENAYHTFRDRLSCYAQLLESGAAAGELSVRKRRLLGGSHPTVWREMQRQHTRIHELRALFAQVPAALAW